MTVRPDTAAAVPAASLWCALAAAILGGLLLTEGLGLNLLVVAAPVVLAAAFAARDAGRRVRPWTLVWSAGGAALLAVPFLRDAGWPTFLALMAAVGAGSLALHGSRTWRGAFLGSVGVFGAVPPGLRWAWHGVREQAGDVRDRWWPVVRGVLAAVLLLTVFGALFAGADAAFADLLADILPDLSLESLPLHALFFALVLAAAVGAARAAAAPLKWDRLEGSRGAPRGRLEWALPLLVLNGLFAAFISVQLAVLFGGYDKVLEHTGLTYAEYARQGFWQLLVVTLLTLLVIALALRWAPRHGGRGDLVLVRSVLGALCVLTLVVVASALRRMDLYVDAYGLTRLRVSVTAMELWLGAVIVLIMAAGATRAHWLPRAVGASAVAAVLAFGLVSPDGLVAEQNVRRYATTGKLDVVYLRQLSADAVPGLDALPEPERSCALRDIAEELAAQDTPWYATSFGEFRARRLLDERPVSPGDPCDNARVISLTEYY
ncbi:DUF4153 domain-containing protein [Streptomyces meridianus]|uniref:DUF4153 domain-containing protein n=1 Tax=Streptomyces meridianus TaxID=2938945 RepID=UPI0027E2C019|nr:DUF4173 domain-containing protein [Streptomyces meridianus]